MIPGILILTFSTVFCDMTEIATFETLILFKAIHWSLPLNGRSKPSSVLSPHW